ncbi:MAG: hypothetical protein ABR568_16395 [Pyrinomonadaceae bacterium]
MKKVRILGWLLVLLGCGLVIFMGGLGIILAGIIVGTGQPGNTTRFTGGTEDVLFIAAIFGLVISFGLATVAGGVADLVWQTKPEVDGGDVRGRWRTVGNWKRSSRPRLKILDVQK